MTRIIGRDRELERLAAFLADRAGTGCLVVQGEAGAGKTTLWRQGVELAHAQGFRVLRSRPLELDVRVPFAGLHDLLGGVLDVVIERLPTPQRRALEVALQRADPDGPPPESSAIAFGLLGGLELLADTAPVLIAVDDVQWLDEPSAIALRFAVHRLDIPVVRLLVAQRAPRVPASALGFERTVEPERFDLVALGGLSLGSIQYILKHELGLEYPRPTLLKLHATSGGNPFYALELARALQRHGGTFEPGRPLPVPETLAALVAQRIASLPETTQRGLEIAAVLAEPTTAVVRAAAGGEVDLAPALSAGVAELDGDRVRFTHPLLASGIAARIADDRRHALHRTLAALVDDPEERVRHTALGAVGEDPNAAAALEAAADVASRRGAPVAAAELLEHALRHTPERAVQDRARRQLATAQATFHAGDWDRALALASSALDLFASGHDRARALLLIGELDGQIAGLERGVADAGDDFPLRARIRIQLAQNYFGHDLHEALRLARAAVLDARAAGDDGLVAQALAMQSWFEAATTTGDPDQTAARAAELERGELTDVGADFTSQFSRGTFAMWRDEHDQARREFESMRAVAAHRGRAFDEAHALLNLAQVQWRAGEWDQATGHIDSAVSLWPRGDQTARSLTLWIGAVLAAHRGELDPARADAERGLQSAGDHLVFRGRNLWVIGLAALCAENVDEAVASLEDAAGLFDRAGALEPGMRLFAADQLDAYLAAGRSGDAERLANALIARGAQLGRRRATVIGARGKALVLAGRGDVEPALHFLARAAREAEHWPVPLEHGRTLLALGTVQRQARRRREARETLGRALALFETIGARPFADQAKAQLRRIAGRTLTGQTLTPAEQRIAELVARGHTNREVAAELVVALHTVESALTRIYSKLGVRSRSELTLRFAAREER